MTRHMLGLFAGMPGARGYRRRLAAEAVRPGAGVDVLLAAVDEGCEGRWRDGDGGGGVEGSHFALSANSTAISAACCATPSTSPV